MTDLEKAAQQEPVGQLMEEAYGRGQVLWFNKPDDFSMLYTSPQRNPWVSLTDDDLDDIATTAKRGNLYDLRLAIEAKLKEKNIK